MKQVQVTGFRKQCKQMHYSTQKDEKSSLCGTGAYYNMVWLSIILPILVMAGIFSLPWHTFTVHKCRYFP